MIFPLISFLVRWDGSDLQGIQTTRGRKNNFFLFLSGYWSYCSGGWQDGWEELLRLFLGGVGGGVGVACEGGRGNRI